LKSWICSGYKLKKNDIAMGLLGNLGLLWIT